MEPSSDSSCREEEDDADYSSSDVDPKASTASRCSTFAIFFVVGAACGWFVADALYQLLTNEPDVQRGGRMFGTFQTIAGAAGLGTAAVNFLYLVASPVKMSFRAEQWSVTVIVAASVLTLSVLSIFWQVGAPQYPVVVWSCAMGNIIGNLTYFLVFPLISSYYAGWLVATLRAGTDVSSLVTALLAEAENPSGDRNLFEPWVLFLVYALLSSAGLVAWRVIVAKEIGLLPELRARAQAQSSCSEIELVEHNTDADDEQSGQSEQSAQAAARGAGAEAKAQELGSETAGGCLSRCCARLACPRVLVVPIALGTCVAAAQWGIVNSLGPIAAQMTDPASCDGSDGRWVFRQAVTLNRVLVPVASISSAMMSCPRWLFIFLASVQLLCSATICLIASGAARAELATEAGQAVFIAAFTLVGALEGYVYTMAYRFIAEAPGLSQADRHSASSLFGLLSVVIVNPIAIPIGLLVEGGTIACTNP